jgi:transposase
MVWRLRSLVGDKILSMNNLRYQLIWCNVSMPEFGSHSLTPLSKSPHDLKALTSRSSHFPIGIAKKYSVRPMVIVLDNISIHIGTEIIDLIERADHVVKFLRPYSPDYNPIELSFAVSKRWMRRHYFSVRKEFSNFEDFLRMAVQDSHCDRFALKQFRHAAHSSYLFVDVIRRRGFNAVSRGPLVALPDGITRLGTVMIAFVGSLCSWASVISPASGPKCEVMAYIHRTSPKALAPISKVLSTLSVDTTLLRIRLFRTIATGPVLGPIGIRT